MLKQGAIAGLAGHGFPPGSIPFFQETIRHFYGFRGGHKPLFDDIYQFAAGGGGGIHQNPHTPVRILSCIGQGSRGEVRGVLMAHLPKRTLRVDDHLSRFGGAGNQAQGDEAHSRDPQQADPKARLAVIQHGFDAVFHADLAKGHGAGGVVHPVGAALQQGGGIGLPLIQLHELHHPLITGDFNVLAQQHIGNPHQGIEPVQGQGNETDHLNPVVALFQMGPLVGENLPFGILGHSGGYVNLRFDKAQHKGGFNLVRFPAPGYLYRVPHLALEPGIGNDADQANHRRHGSPEKQQPSSGVDGDGNGEPLGLEAEPAGHRNGHQQPNSCQHPQEADVLFRGFPQQKPQQDHGENDDAAVKAGGEKALKEGTHIHSSW